MTPDEEINLAERERLAQEAAQRALHKQDEHRRIEERKKLRKEKWAKRRQSVASFFKTLSYIVTPLAILALGVFLYNKSQSKPELQSGNFSINISGTTKPATSSTHPEVSPEAIAKLRDLLIKEIGKFREELEEEKKLAKIELELYEKVAASLRNRGKEIEMLLLRNQVASLPEGGQR